eukprot:CAMPEP_0115002324 /NCGR_PEP_ID=MMETSP0216-20121206/17930_1 /TAXON_ID=223996 /ORGANISM="Protocruzia adherens, Strain Boccale" /LENGTH=122 /DNA_ID=CAMNT_0002367881 /DNA_START=31 /DNA_END=399 /DNA_ORIENTATION=+
MTEVMTKVEEFYFGDGEDQGEHIFKKFAEKHMALFETEENAEDTEHKLEYTQAYKEFQSLFETKLEEIVKSCSTTPEEFYTQIKEASEQKDENAEAFVTIMLALTDYASFYEMMIQQKNDSG